MSTVEMHDEANMQLELKSAVLVLQRSARAAGGQMQQNRAHL